MILALDIALATGWACGGPTMGAPDAGVIHLPNGNLDRGLVSLREWVAMKVRTNAVTTVFIEAPMKQINWKHGAASLIVLVSLHAVAREAAARSGAEVRLANCQTWRKSFLGRGNLSTEDAKAGAIRRCGQLGWPHGDDHNAAEAMGIFYWAMAGAHPRWQPGRAA